MTECERAQVGLHCLHGGVYAHGTARHVVASVDVQVRWLWLCMACRFIYCTRYVLVSSPQQDQQACLSQWGIPLRLDWSRIHWGGFDSFKVVIVLLRCSHCVVLSTHSDSPPAPVWLEYHLLERPH